MVSSAERTASAAPTVRRAGASSLPAPSGRFWLLAALAAVLAEAGADGLGARFAASTAVAATWLPAALLIAAQLRVRRHVPALFWSALAAAGLAASTAVDAEQQWVGLTHQVLVASLVAAVATTLATGRRLTGAVPPAPRSTSSAPPGVSAGGGRQGGFWALLLGVLALGTALGDWATASLDLGFLGSAVLWALVAALPAIAHGVGLDATAAFWCAVLAVRPLGASLADWCAVPVPHGGLGWGYGVVAAAGGGLLAVAGAVLTLTRADAA